MNAGTMTVTLDENRLAQLGIDDIDGVFGQVRPDGEGDAAIAFMGERDITIARVAKPDFFFGRAIVLSGPWSPSGAAPVIEWCELPQGWRPASAGSAYREIPPIFSDHGGRGVSVTHRRVFPCGADFAPNAQPEGNAVIAVERDDVIHGGITTKRCAHIWVDCQLGVLSPQAAHGIGRAFLDAVDFFEQMCAVN